jgi:hypothetical protein
VEGGTTVTVFGAGFMRYRGNLLCRFGSEGYHDSYFDMVCPPLQEPRTDCLHPHGESDLSHVYVFKISKTWTPLFF